MQPIVEQPEMLIERFLSQRPLIRREPVMPLSTEMKVEAGAAPAAGFEDITVKDAPGQEATFLSSIAAARQEAQTLFELS